MADFPINDYKSMLRTRHTAAQLGIPAMEPWPTDRAARLMAIVQVFGNNEGFTLSPKFNADREYIQAIYGLSGGERPDTLFADELRKWVRMFEKVKTEDDTDFRLAHGWIMSMYNFKLCV